MARSTPHHDLTHPDYRADIDGLRAIAVLSVVLYHASPLWVRGGFAGVDIFFVISGFLISSIIFDNLRQDSFSFAVFYGRRIRRIFPALLLVLTASLAAGWFLFTPDEYRQLGLHVAGGAGFVSNFILWRESGYFDSAAATKPLLHLWSLGIEEQFYIVWPLLLWAAWKKNVNWLSATIAIVLLSFALNLALAHTDAVADFYAPQARFWELLAGAILANPALRNSATLASCAASLDRRLGPILFEKAPAANGATLRDAASVLGGALIVTALAAISDAQTYPSAWALLPVAGTMLAIMAGREAWLNRVVLANPVLVWFGLISYPLYLWHWPLLSMARILGLIDPEAPSRLVRFAAVAISVGLAWATWRFVERPVRKPGHRGAKALVLIAAMIAVGAAGYYVYAANGVLSRPIARDTVALSTYDYFEGVPIPDYWHRHNRCFLQQYDGYEALDANRCAAPQFPGRPAVFLTGDSHAGYLSPELGRYLAERRLNFLQATAIFCVPFIAHDARDRCNAINDHVLKMVADAKPDVLVLFANYASYQADPQNREKLPYDQLLLQRVRQYAALGAKRIIIMGQIPVWDDVLPNILLRRFVLKHRPIPDRTFENVTRASLAEDAVLKALPYPPNASYVSLKDFLCDASGCLARTGADMKSDLIVQDAAHLTHAGADLVTRKLLAKYLPAGQ
jgi:peptidoglycan/LPS O-acetylase OafA/YrhL